MCTTQPSAQPIRCMASPGRVIEIFLEEASVLDKVAVPAEYVPSKKTFFRVSCAYNFDRCPSPGVRALVLDCVHVSNLGVLA